MRPASHNGFALASSVVQKAIETSAMAQGLTFQHLPSGAGHDAQMLASVCPMGMIFVPSINGISHSPQENTAWTDCANGMHVLLHSRCCYWPELLNFLRKFNLQRPGQSLLCFRARPAVSSIPRLFIASY